MRQPPRARSTAGASGHERRGEERRKALAVAVRWMRLRSSPTLAMALVLTAAGGAGFVTTFTLYALGVKALGVRWAFAVLVGYSTFLWGCYTYLRELAGSSGGARWDWLDPGLPDLPPNTVDPSWHGGGGAFGGAGCTGSFEAPAVSPNLALEDAPAPANPSSQIDPPGPGDFSLDDFFAGLVLLLLGTALVAVPLYLLAHATEFFAELVVDGFVSFRVYRRLTRKPGPNWLPTALNKTAPGFLALFVLFLVGGTVLQALYPDAETLGAVLHRLLTT